jgi:signal transduction histidine kinase
MAKNYTFEKLGLLHSEADSSILNIVNLASCALDAPVSFVSVLEIKSGTQYISAAAGDPLETADFCGMPIEDSICRYVQQDQKTVAIPDLLKDFRTRNNKVVTESELRSYVGSPIRAMSGKVIGAVCCMTPEPRNWTEEDVKVLESLANCINDIVKARALALEERQAREKLQEVMATRSNYIAHVSHEIRTPLTGIIASIKMLNGMSFEGKAGQLVGILDRSANKLLDFVNDVLDLAKLDVGHFESSEEEASIGDIVADVLSGFTDLADAKSLQIETTDELEDCFYLVDKHAVRTILQNLIGNAIKFTKVGSVRVKITEDSYGQVVIDVIDTGIGIAPEYHAKIFEEFEQAGPDIPRTYGGTGLGMTIVKRMVDLLDGTITLQSRLGEGAKFSVSLPLQSAGRRQDAFDLQQKLAS